QLSKCTRVDFAVDGLDTWLDQRGIRAEPLIVDRKIVGCTVSYRMPDVSSVPIQDGLQLSVKWESKLPMGTPLTEATITQTAFLSLTSNTPKPLGDFLQAVRHINTFLCFAIDEVVTLTM